MNETILKLLTEEFPEVDFSASDTLVDDGILDSLTITGIIATLSMEFGITIPYEEIEFIRVEKEGREIASIIENGRFSLVGTEELNRVLDETC